MTPSPEHHGGEQNWTRTQTAFCPVHCAQQPHLSRNLRGIRPQVNSNAGDRDIFSTRLHKHAGSRKNLPLIAGNHGNWHQLQETVSRNACAWNHIRATAAATEAFGEQRGLSSGASAWLDRNRAVILIQILRMNAKSKRAFLGKKGAIHPIRKLTRHIHHTYWWKWSWGCTRAWIPGQDWLLDLGRDSSSSLYLHPDIIYQVYGPEFWMQEKLKVGKTQMRREHACSRRKSGMDHATFLLGSRFCFLKEETC